jgi:flagellar basal body-associated protein FliL
MNLNFDKILLVILAAIALTIIIVSTAVFTTKKTSPYTTTVAESAEPPAEKVWSGIGRLRAPLKAPKSGGKGSVVVVSIGFPYDSNDKAFTEELAFNNKRFKQEALNYFATLDDSATSSLNEDNLKRELLKKFNSPLRLGKIETLYFSEFMILD